MSRAPVIIFRRSLLLNFSMLFNVVFRTLAIFSKRLSVFPLLLSLFLSLLFLSSTLSYQGFVEPWENQLTLSADHSVLPQPRDCSPYPWCLIQSPLPTTRWTKDNKTPMKFDLQSNLPIKVSKREKNTLRVASTEVQGYSQPAVQP